jgi:hypothetical protein
MKRTIIKYSTALIVSFVVGMSLSFLFPQTNNTLLTLFGIRFTWAFPWQLAATAFTLYVFGDLDLQEKK